jgi:hypothetical protein
MVVKSGAKKISAPVQNVEQPVRIKNANPETDANKHFRYTYTQVAVFLKT